jgi:antitoxin component of RelBE/YafQ-DinJ toxin-antitoxin module
MGRALHVRLDESAAAALSVLRSDGLTDSKAVRVALRETAARRRSRASIAAETRQLAADEDDRAEMRAVREQMAELAPEPLA